MIAKAKKIGKRSKKAKANGNYRIIMDDDYSLTVAPEGSPDLFNMYYGERNLTERARVLFYIDKENIDGPKGFEIKNGFEIKLAEGFAMHSGSYFKVRLATNQDSESARFAEYADVIINSFRQPSDEFLERLERYRDAGKLFLDISGIWEELGGRANDESVANYVCGLRADLERGQVSSLEAAVA